MARSRQSSTDKDSHDSDTEGHTPHNGHSGEGTPDWLSGSLANPKAAVDSVLEMQRQLLKTASMGSETLAMELKELQDAKDPMEFVSAQISLANQQLEILARQVSAVLQQIYDAQLLWMGQWSDKSADKKSAPSSAQQNNPALSALTKVQDDWLKISQSWIDSIHAANAAR